VNEFDVKAVGVAAVWGDMDPLPPLALKVTTMPRRVNAAET
jgi:hypothetical protein